MKRLTENHPIHVKIEKVFSLMDELGISISVISGRTFVSDVDFPDKELDLEDLESRENITDMPPLTEYALRF